MRPGLLALCAAAVCVAAARCQPCVSDVDTPGVTIPRGDIVLEYGNKLEIYCIINTSHALSRGRDASHLRFYRNQTLVAKGNVEILNTTTAKLTETPDPSRSIYVCKLERKPREELLVCANMVVVGYRPKPVDNFTCVSENWKNLNCSWKERENPIATYYTLRFHLPGRSGGTNQFACPGNTERLHYCHWNRMTTPKYRTEYEYYYFQFTGKNALGETVFPKIQFHHYGHVIPSKPYRLTYHNVTTNSVYLEWDLHHHIKHFPPGFNYKLQYKALCDSLEEWKTVNTSGIPNKVYSFLLSGLEYANSPYEVRLFIQSRVAAADGIWSQPAIVKFRTKPEVPKFPPRTQEGSFQVVKQQNHRDIIIYWQQIPKCAENGDGFNYKIMSVEENSERDIKPEYIGMSYAHFKKLTLKSYKFEIVSENNIGRSEDKSIIFVPSEIERPPEPTGLTRYVTKDKTIHISWNPVSNSTWSGRIHSYTLFWCHNDYQEPNHCSGMLNWIYSHKNSTHVELSVKHGNINDFAISANSYSGSSGMTWVTCTLQSENELMKIDTFYVNAKSSSSIEVRFHLNCATSLLHNVFYGIFYCPVAVPGDSTCEAPHNKTVHSNTGEIITVITELLPYTKYIIYITPLLIRDGEIVQYGEASDIMYSKTFQSAPSLPRTVSLCDVTNQSLVVKWKPPLHMNGMLQYYIVRFNGKSVTTSSTKQLEVKLENLKSFTQYEVSVSACTIACSNFTVPVNITTAIGVPGAVNKISASMKKSSEIEVEWDPPTYKGGYLDFYELKVISLSTQNSSAVQHFFSSSLQYVIPVPECHQAQNSYSLSIRAVNKNESNYTFYGPWSEKDIFCKAIGQTQSVHMAIGAAGSAMSLVLIAFIMFTRRCIAWWNSAQKVEVKLPPGLAPWHDEDKDGHTDVTWLLKGNNLHMTQNTQAVADNKILIQQDRDWPDNHSEHGDGQLYAALGIDMPANCGNEMDQRVSLSQVIVANLSLEEVSVLGYHRTNHLRRDDISGHMSVTGSTHSLSEIKNNYSGQGDWSLSDCIVGENISVGQIYSDSYCFNDIKQTQEKKTENSYVGFTCKPETSFSFSDLSSLSSVSYNLPGHSPLVKNFINRQNSLVSLSNQCSHSESELFKSGVEVKEVEKNVSEESENISVEDFCSEDFCSENYYLQSLEQLQQENSASNYTGLIYKPDATLSLSDLSSLSSMSYNLPGDSGFLKKIINSGNSQDSLAKESFNSECELSNDVIEEGTAKNGINEEKEKEILVKTRTKLNLSMLTLTTGNHVPDSYCRIGVHSATSTAQEMCEVSQKVEYQPPLSVDVKYKAKSIDLQTESEFSDIVTDEDVCSMLSDFEALENVTDMENSEHKAIICDHYVATNPAVIVTNTG